MHPGPGNTGRTRCVDVRLFAQAPLVPLPFLREPIVIHICIPVHNEAETIGILLWKIRKVMAEFGRDYTIRVLDDASTDATPQVLDRYRRSLPLVVERSNQVLGYGAAVETLLRGAVEASRYPKRDVAVTLQADFTESPDDLVTMVKAVEGGADLVVGQLDLTRTPLPRSLRLGRWAGRALLGNGPRRLSISDPLSGFRAYRLIVLRKAFRDLGGSVVRNEGASRPGDAEAVPGSPPAVVAREGAWAANVALLACTAPHARRIDETPYALRLDPRVRPTRFRVVDELKALLPLRKVVWPAANAAEAA